MERNTTWTTLSHWWARMPSCVWWNWNESWTRKKLLLTQGELFCKGLRPKGRCLLQADPGPNHKGQWAPFLVEKFTSVGWYVRLADISTGPMDEDIDCELYCRWDSKCYKLQMTMSCLKPSPHLWLWKLKKNVKKFGYTRLESCKRVFKLENDTYKVIISVSVDDLVILSLETQWSQMLEKRVKWPTHVDKLRKGEVVIRNVFRSITKHKFFVIVGTLLSHFEAALNGYREDRANPNG